MCRYALDNTGLSWEQIDLESNLFAIAKVHVSRRKCVVDAS